MEECFMTTLLVIKAHPHIDKSNSLTVGDAFIEAYRQAHPDDQIKVRDLYDPEGVPPLNDLTMGAWKKQKMGQKLTADEAKLLKRHDEWLDEFINADKYVFINPMYDHFLPAELKLYIDIVSVARKTFRYTKNGPEGLLHNKKALHIQSAGSFYHLPDKPELAKWDLGDLYLTGSLKFFGVQDIEKIFIEGVDAQRDRQPEILAAAVKQAQDLAPRF